MSHGETLLQEAAVAGHLKDVNARDGSPPVSDCEDVGARGESMKGPAPPAAFLGALSD